MYSMFDFSYLGLLLWGCDLSLHSLVTVSNSQPSPKPEWITALQKHYSVTHKDFDLWTYREPAQICWGHRRGTACCVRWGWVCAESDPWGGEWTKAHWEHKHKNTLHISQHDPPVLLPNFKLPLSPMDQMCLEQGSRSTVEKPWNKVKQFMMAVKLSH